MTLQNLLNTGQLALHETDAAQVGRMLGKKGVRHPVYLIRSNDRILTSGSDHMVLRMAPFRSLAIRVNLISPLIPLDRKLSLSRLPVGEADMS